MDGSGSRRRAARVVVLDPADRILLINARDPFGRDRRDWWEIPGGGIDRGEHTHDAVRRGREIRQSAVGERLHGFGVWQAIA